MLFHSNIVAAICFVVLLFRRFGFRYNGDMRFTLIILLGFLIAVPLSSVTAQEDNPFLVTEPTRPSAEGEVTSQPYCFNLINQASYSVSGNIATNYFTRPDGIRARHRSNFRLEAKGRKEFCTSGPFYDGYKVELTLRTLVPIFSCKTTVTGDVWIYGRQEADGSYKTTASCL